jgi:glycosyltransferase involved in cell wall biosynthesis
VRVAVLIPCLDEEPALAAVLDAIPAEVRVVLCDNGSTDASVSIARAHSAEVVHEPRRGYGGALQAGLRLLAEDPPAIVVVLDGDRSVDLADLPALLAPLRAGTADLVLGERLTRAEPGALTTPQRVGNRVATTLIRLRTGVSYQDMGPFRALTWAALERLHMEDPTWGWNVEMQMKAARLGLRVVEVPVACRVRVGRSKISGTITGVARAGARIVWACWRYG